MEETTMRKRIEGMLEEHTGKAREALGRFLHERDMERNGARMQREGRARSEAARGEERAARQQQVEDRAQELAGDVPEDEPTSGVHDRAQG